MGCRSMKPRRMSCAERPVSFAAAATRSSSEGDSMVPGQIALTRIPCRMKSAATALVSPMTAALVAP